MEIINLSETNSVLNQYLKEIRCKEIQQDSMRFRKNLERIGEIMAYEISKRFNYSPDEIETPLGKTTISNMTNQLVISTILRAGLPFHQGFLNYFDKAENAFVSAYRKYKDALKFEIFIEYIASPDLNNKTFLFVDPMLATGSSLELSYRALLTKGKPSQVHIASIISSAYAIDYVVKNMQDTNITLWTAAIDPELDEHSYIVPGLGDAGDLAYGSRM